MIRFLPPDLIDWLRELLHFDPRQVGNDNGRRAKALPRVTHCAPAPLGEIAAAAVLSNRTGRT